MLTSRERLDRCFRHKEIDRPGLFIRGVDGKNPLNDSYRKLLEMVLKACDLKNIIYLMQYKDSSDIAFKKEAFTEDFERHIITLHTPAGELHKSYLVGLKGNPGYIEKHFIETLEDAETYMSMPEQRMFFNTEDFFEEDRRLGDRGVTVIELGLNPAGSVVDLLGSENFAIWSIENREMLHSLMERERNILANRIKVLVKEKAGPYFAMLGEEYITPPLHGAKDFYEFNVKYDKPLIDLIHDSGSYIHIHSHGPLKNVLHHFKEMGVDVLHPIEAPPMGDVPIKEAKEILKGRVCIEGNIQIGDIYERNPAEISNMVNEIIKEAFYDHEGLIVCPTASPFAPEMSERVFRNYSSLISAVLNYNEAWG